MARLDRLSYLTMLRRRISALLPYKGRIKMNGYGVRRLFSNYVIHYLRSHHPLPIEKMLLSDPFVAYALIYPPRSQRLHDDKYIVRGIRHVSLSFA